MNPLHATTQFVQRLWARMIAQSPSPQCPCLPIYRGYWWAVYWYPVPGVNERVTAFVVAIGSDGATRVRRTLNTDSSSGMLAKAADRLSDTMLSTIEWVIHRDIAILSPDYIILPYGFQWSHRRSLLAENIDQIAVQGMIVESSPAATEL